MGRAAGRRLLQQLVHIPVDREAKREERGNARGPARALELICIVRALCIICIVQASLHALLCVALDTTLHIAYMSP